MPEPTSGRPSSPDPAFRAALVGAAVRALESTDDERIVHTDEAEVMLDAVLPVLANWIKPHRWDRDYTESAPDACRGAGVDSFYAGVLHASAVVRDLLPPKRREELEHA